MSYYCGLVYCINKYEGEYIVTVFTVLHFVKRCMCDRSVLTQYSYYSDFFCSWPALRLRNWNCHGWVRYINNMKTTVWCMSLLILSIDLLWLCYFIMFYFKLKNGVMVKWWMVKCCNGKIKIRIGCLVPHNIESVHLFYFRTQHFCSRQSNS